ncbi:hypothetical protein ACEWY4_001029 [Coilia grayii]|uniref:Transcription factor HES-5 n=1 Tax=Coilia grayii TaxID=363190 RepID=A0ABD1KYV7_9TELE
MAPYVAALPAYHSLALSDKNTFKLRKPLVEKMRRDRINSCIDQLKSLLEREFHSQDPNTKLEKADILEMTVSFLKRQRQLGSGALGQRDYSEGYSQCWRESVHFLTVSSCRGAALPEHHSPQRRTPQDLTSALSSPSSSSPSTSSSAVSSISSSVISKHNSVSVIHHAVSKRPVWRPW